MSAIIVAISEVLDYAACTLLQCCANILACSTVGGAIVEFQGQNFGSFDEVLQASVVFGAVPSGKGEGCDGHGRCDALPTSTNDDVCLFQ